VSCGKPVFENALLHDLYRVFEWFSANSGAHATVSLVIITAFYVFLTDRVTKAMVRQTRAMIQPILSLKMVWTGSGLFGKYPTKGRVFIENQGNQPAVLLESSVAESKTAMLL
jgi:hypothetical protein